MILYTLLLTFLILSSSTLSVRYIMRFQDNRNNAVKYVATKL